jgi:hypothetical protein
MIEINDVVEHVETGDKGFVIASGGNEVQVVFESEKGERSHKWVSRDLLRMVKINDKQKKNIKRRNNPSH